MTASIPWKEFYIAAEEDMGETSARAAMTRRMKKDGYTEMRDFSRTDDYVEHSTGKTVVLYSADLR